MPEPNESVYGEKPIRGARGGTKEHLVPLMHIYEEMGTGTIMINRELLEQTIGCDKSYLHYHVGWFQDTVPAEGKQADDMAIL
jgi:hypothetical protein